MYLNHSAFKPIRRLPEHMLATVPSDSPYVKHHDEISVVFNPTQSTPISDDPASDVNKAASSVGRKKQMAKQKKSPSKI